MKITVAGIGYVGLSVAVLLAQHNEVTAIDIDAEKVNLVNRRISPVRDKEIEEYLLYAELNLTAVTDPQAAYADAGLVVIAAPTNYDETHYFFDTTAVESVIETVFRYNSSCPVVIKSTVPVGYTKAVNQKYCTDRILFSPEFLREGNALHDNLHPSRIIVGEKSERAAVFAALLAEGAVKKDIDVLYTDSTEAEAIKLFANSYLALRVAFFNELDTFCEVKGLDSRQIIEGIGLDPRIGNHYHNPSFGYGGYCLPKDSKQLLANYGDIPETIISAIVSSNDVRKQHIAQTALRRNPKTVGIYRLTMKAESDNFRASAIRDIMRLVRGEGVDVIVYEPTLSGDSFHRYPVISDLETFKQMSDVILANRYDHELDDVRDKVYTRDLYEKDE